MVRIRSVLIVFAAQRPGTAVALRRAMNRSLLLAAAVLALAGSLACKAESLERPLDVGPVASGPGSIEAERRRLQGSWRLDRFEVIDSAGAARVVRAEAILTYDEYGNLTVRGKLLEPIPGEKTIEHPLLQYAGPIVIDPPKQQFRLGAIKAPTAIDPGLESKIDPSFLRKYELTDTTLKISYLNASGSPTAIASFTRQ